MKIGPRTGASLLTVAALAMMGAGQNWTLAIERGEAFHTVGNPDAEMTVADFSSYTCSHCGHYARTGGEVMKLAYVGSGKTRVEMRHVIRNPIDLAAAMAAWCGPKDKFLRNHAALMFAQDDWLEKAGTATAAQKQRWVNGPIPQRLRNIASDLGFYEIFEQRGYDRPALDRCLADTERMEALVAATGSDAAEYGVRSTPSFAIDGALLDGVHGWDALQPQIQARLDEDQGKDDGLGESSELSSDSAFSLE